MAAVSPAFDRFRRSLEADGARERFDGLDLEALRRLTGDERDQAEDLLVAKLRDENDGRAAEALAILGSPRARQTLEDALARLGPGAARVAVARALQSLGGDDAALQAVLETLRTGAWSQRATAARTLADFPGPATDAALFTALGDSHALVRLNAADALVALRGATGQAQGHWQPLGLMKVALGADLPCLRTMGAKRLESVIRTLDAGGSPTDGLLAAAVDLQASPARDLLEAAQAAPDERDLQAPLLAMSTGFDLVWAVVSLLANHLDDPRTPPALEALLREAGGASDDDAETVRRDLASDDVQARDTAARKVLEDLDIA